MSYIGGVYSVENVYFKDGDESEDPMIFCELKDIDFEKTIKDVPCYSSVLSVVNRMEQLEGLRLKDKVILKDITEYDYRTMYKKVSLQELLGTIFEIVKIVESLDYHGREFSKTRYAIISPVEKDLSIERDESILFVVPLVDRFVEKLN
tara:strand:- start:103 stop:549 length:447 start_codon:yes stop_codon:yes gene_type:complete